MQTLLIILIVFLGSGAESRASCAQVLERFIDRRTPPIAREIRDLLPFDLGEKLAAEAAPLIAEVYKDETLTPLEKAGHAFGIFLELRLAYVSEEVREQVLAFVENADAIQIGPHNPSKLASIVRTTYKIEGSQLSQKTQIHMNFPESQLGLEVSYWVLIHELEHYIQNLSVGAERLDAVAMNVGESRLHPRKLELKPAKYLVSFSKEQGAMIAEGAFMKSLPLEIIESYPYDMPILNSDGSLMSLRDYVRAQWRGGRYSKVEFLKDYLLETSVAVGWAAAAAIVPCGIFWLVH